MNNKQPWFVSLMRLSLAALIISWAGWSVYLIRANARRNLWLVASQFNPNAGPLAAFIPSNERWPMVTATAEFQALSPDQRVQFAESFYAQKIQGLVQNLDYDPEDIRRWFIRSATMSPSEAPAASIYSRLENKNIPYRMYSNYPRPRLSKDIFNRAVFQATTITLLAIWGFSAFFVALYITFVKKAGVFRRRT